MTKPDKEILQDHDLQEQIDLLFEQLRSKEIDVHQFMKLLGMVYGDYLDFHPTEHPYYYDRQRIEATGRKHID